jgi:hypothetical protein
VLAQGPFTKLEMPESPAEPLFVLFLSSRWILPGEVVANTPHAPLSPPLRPQPLAKTENVAAQMWPAAEILYHATDILRSASGALPGKAAWSWSTFGCRTRLADTAATEWALWKTLPVSIARIFQAVRTEKAGVADCGGAGLREAIRCYQKQTKYANNDFLGLP